MCTECGVVYASFDVAAALEVIRGVPAAVGAAVSSVSDAQLRQRPDDTTWSALEYVCHIRDVYAVYTIRLYRTRVEDRATLEPMLNDLRAARFRYNSRDVVAVLAELADNVAGLVDEAARVRDDGWNRVATRLPGEERTARWLIRQAMHEGTHHLRDISSVLSRVDAISDPS